MPSTKSKCGSPRKPPGSKRNPEPLRRNRRRPPPTARHPAPLLHRLPPPLAHFPLVRNPKPATFSQRSGPFTKSRGTSGPQHPKSGISWHGFRVLPPLPFRSSPTPPRAPTRTSLEDLGEELKSLLTADEYASAKRTTFNAFYTSPVVISAMHTRCAPCRCSRRRADRRAGWWTVISWLRAISGSSRI